MKASLITILLLLTVNTVGAAAQPSVGKVFALEGTAWRGATTTDLDSRNTPLAVGDSVHERDYLQTGEQSKLQIVFGTCRTKLSLGPDSRLHLERYVRKLRARKREGSSILSLLKGKLQFITTALFGSRHRMTVKAESATCAIRGTRGLAMIGRQGTVFANLTGDGTKKGPPSMLIWAHGKKKLPKDPAKLFALASRQGRGLAPGSMFSWRSGRASVAPLTADLLAAANTFIRKQADRQRLASLALAALAAAKKKGQGGKTGKGAFQKHRRAISQILGTSIKPPKTSALPQYDSKTLLNNLSRARYKVEVERITPLEGNNPLNPSNPLVADAVNALLPLSGNAIRFREVNGAFFAGFDVDPTTFQATLRNDGGGRTLTFRTPPNLQQPPTLNIETYPQGGWGMGTFWDESFPPVPHPYIFPVGMPQTVTLNHVGQPFTTIQVIFLIETTLGKQLADLEAQDYVLRLISVIEIAN